MRTRQRMMVQRDVPICENHPNEPDLPYLAWHSDAADRAKRKEVQLLCPKCQRWVWTAHITVVNPLKHGFLSAHMSKQRERSGR